MEKKSAIVAHMLTEQGGSILVRCEGCFISSFSLSYEFEGLEFSKHSGDIFLGVNKTESVPVGAKNLFLKVEEMWGFGWSTIFTQRFAEPVQKCYKVYGTTLNPKWIEI